MKYSNFQDIPPFTRDAIYCIDISWTYLEQQIANAAEGVTSFELNPDFQRGHVWTEAQQIAFVEFALRGGQTGRHVYFNCAGFHTSVQGQQDGPYVCVDGLQRITAVRRFMASEIPAFGTLYKDYEGRFRPMQRTFKWHVNDLKSRAEVLKWYLEFNSGGTPHTEAELERVRKLLDHNITDNANCGDVK